MVLLVFFTFITFAQRIPILGLSSFVVLSGSMSPVFEAGDIVMVAKTPVSSLKVNDIIAFDDPNIPGRIITHRIASFEKKGNQEFFRTKGDANTAADTWEVPAAAVKGRMINVIPGIGYLVAFIKTLQGFALFILLPGGVLILSELYSLTRYIRSLEERVKNDKVFA